MFKATALLKDTRAVESDLSKLQNLAHDVMATPTRLLYCLEQPEPFPVDKTKSMVVQAIRLLGNASANISRLHRRRILKPVNPGSQDIAEKDLFQSVAPNLFEKGFEGIMKERAKSLKLLSAGKAPSRGQGRKLFPTGRPTPQEEARTGHEVAKPFPRRNDHFLRQKPDEH